ncbi:MAG: O-antigen ligase family protein [Patescibacteria group bacterium]|nr:O-antigen ligase family protein [Patescibacteria group bacterium]
MNYLERAYPWLLLSPVILPVVIWGDLIYPYLVPKTLLFYALSFVAVAVFVILASHGRAFFWARLSRKAAWIPGLLLVLAYVASAYGVDFYRSFWSLFIRGDGLLMLSCAVLSFYLILLAADRAFFVRLLRSVAVVGSFVALYGIGEWLLGGGRIGGLLGNAAFFAGYLGIAFFATLAAAQDLSPSWRRAAYSGAALQVLAIVLTATRGTMLALAIAAVAYLCAVAFQGEGRTRAAAAGSLAAFVLLGGLFFALRGELAHAPFEPVARIASIGTNDPDIRNRLFIWEHMMAEIQQSPWLGVGAEHIDALFNRFYDPTQISEQWFDRSHNAFLDYAAQYGVGGLALYLALIASFFTTALRMRRPDASGRREEGSEKHIALIFALLALTYAVQNFFVFDTVSSFWLLLALLAAFLSISSEEEFPEALPLPSWTRYASWLFALALALLIIPASVRPALAAYDLAQAYKYPIIDAPKEISYLSHGIALGTYADIEYGYEAYDMYGNYQARMLTGQARVDAYQATRSILSANFDKYPYDARTALYLAHILTLAPAGVSVDRGLLSSALERAIRLSPKRYQPWFVLANLSISEANTFPVGSSGRAEGYAAAEDVLRRYLSLVPTLAEPHFVLAQLMFASGDAQGAATEAAKGKADYTQDLDTARRAAAYYIGVKDWAFARFFLQDVAALAPTDYASVYDLAKVTYLSGDPAAADAIVASLRTSSPGLLSTDQNFLNAITAYEQSKK